MDVKVRRALISVSDKTGIVEFSNALKKLGVEILSTGGTAALLESNGISVTEVFEYTQFPEMMDGRVKTLHPKVHGGILGRRGEDDQVMEEHGIKPIDLVVVNLYPFEQTITDPKCDTATAIENIDIGGPTMIRAAAKNHMWVSIIVDPKDYGPFLNQLVSNQGQVSGQSRLNLARKSFEHTAHYDSVIAKYMNSIVSGDFPENLNLQYSHSQTMRYGENPHQKSAFYVETNPRSGTIATSGQLQGKALSYNNIADTDAALGCVKQFADRSTCVIVKHANPCGVAQGNTLHEAYEQAYATDPTSAFGGIIAFNRALDGETAKTIIDRQFVEVIIAPEITQEARSILKGKDTIRVLECGQWQESEANEWEYKKVSGGLLVQDVDFGSVTEKDLRSVTQRHPTSHELEDLLFAWKTVKFVKSNAVVYCKNRKTLGIGAGQMSRVYSSRIAAIKAQDEGLEIQGSVMASDAFFPFRDSIDAAAAAGIIAVIQPGGSMRDEEVISAADEHAMAMVFTGMRHFRH